MEVDQMTNDVTSHNVSSAHKIKSKLTFLQTLPIEDQEQNLDKPDIYKFDCTKSNSIDANICSNRNINDDNLIDTQLSTSTIFTPIPIDDIRRYNMNHKNRGKCIIFNNENFDLEDNKRQGSTIDVESLKKSFDKLGFDIEIEKDLTHMEVMDKIEKLRQYNHTDNDCLCIIVLTHGEQDLLWAKDVAYKPEKIWEPFTADKCTTLAEKPKLFFIQACRGNQVDNSIVLSSRSLTPFDTPDIIKSYKIPTHADFLIVHSSVQDFYSWRNPKKGSWYIQCLCKILDLYGTEKDLMSILTLTTQEVTTYFASNNTTQVPSVTTMLTRLVYFPPKSNDYSVNY